MLKVFFLSFLLIFPLKAFSEELSRLSGSLKDYEAFSLILNYKKSLNNEKPSEADLDYLNNYLLFLADNPYPLDKMHGSNRAFDTTARTIYELLGEGSKESQDAAYKLSANKDVPTLSKLVHISHLAHNDEKLVSLIEIYEIDESLDVIQKNLLVSNTISILKSPTEQNISRLSLIIADKSLDQTHLLTSIRFDWQPEYYLPLAYELMKKNIIEYQKLLRNLDKVPLEVLEKNQEFISLINLGDLDDPEALSSIVITKKMMNIINDEELIEFLKKERHSEVKETIVEELLDSMSHDTLTKVLETLDKGNLKTQIESNLSEHQKFEPQQ